MSQLAITLKLLRKGDQVVNVWERHVAIRRTNGEVDVIALMEDDLGTVRVDPQRSYKIGYGEGTVETKVSRAKSPGRGHAAESEAEEIEVTTF
jgi:hypothetical protein